MTGTEPQRSADLLQFVDSLMAQQGLGEMDINQEVLDEMRNDLYARVDHYLKDYLVTCMTPEEQAVLRQLVEDNDVDGIQKHIVNSVPELEATVSEALVSFQSNYLNR